MLPCMNCRKEVSEEDARFFGGDSLFLGGGSAVFVCPLCFQMADHFYRNGRRELEQLLTLLRESIRIALIEGRLHFGEGHPKDVSKADLFQEIVKMETYRDAHCHRSPQHGHDERKPRDP